MSKKIAYAILFMATVLTGFISCKKNTDQIQEKEYNGFSVQEGRLVFDSESAFKKTLELLYSSQDDLDKWESKVIGYTSLRTKFEKLANEDPILLNKDIGRYKFVFTLIEEENSELSMERNIYNDVFATLVNADGYLQIGSTVHRFTYSHVYSVDVKDLEVLKSENFASQVVKSKEIKREFVFEDTNQNNSRSYTTGECTTTSGSFRVKGLIVREEIFDNDCNISTKHQKKVLGIWWANSTSIAVSFSGNFVKLFSSCNPVPKPFFADSGSAGSSSSISRTVPGNHSSWNGCNGEVTPFHDGVYFSSHTAGGKNCTLSCPPGAPCN